MNVIRPALVLLALFTVLCGGLYPLAVTGAAQAIFPKQANGSLVQKDGAVVGSELIGQPFSANGYFWSRRSVTAPHPFNGGASSGSNLGPTNPALREAVEARIAELQAADPGNPLPIPVDLVTASGSGLDPHISPAAAQYQVRRVARERNLAVRDVEALVAEHTEGRFLGLVGEPRVNVLRLNLALDARAGGPPKAAPAPLRPAPSAP